MLDMGAVRHKAKLNQSVQGVSIEREWADYSNMRYQEAKSDILERKWARLAKLVLDAEVDFNLEKEKLKHLRAAMVRQVEVLGHQRL